MPSYCPVWILCALAAALTFSPFPSPLKAQNILPDQREESQTGIRWKPLLTQSLFFLGVEHGFRLASEKPTRDNLPGRFFDDWGRSVGNLHGWADGDDFLINYVGHPMQGAVSGYIWVQNDLKYQRTEFGKNRAYWKSRLRATAFAWAFSEQFEIGPISEATIGRIQARYPQQGYVDHVITPAMGLGWMLAEDALDKYVIARIESRTQNRWIKLLVRGGLNPSRSMANAMRLEVPWHRDTRPGVWRRGPTQIAQVKGIRSFTNPGLGASAKRALQDAADDANPGSETPIGRVVPKFELGIEYSYFRLSAGTAGAQSCNGGGATAVWNVNSLVGLVADVGGCKMMSAGHNVSGDSTSYLFGPRFAFRNNGRFIPYVQALIGGDKLTTETIYPERKPAQIHVTANSVAADTIHSLYTTHAETNDFSWQAGGGVDYTFTRAIGWKVAELDYLHIGTGNFNATSFHDNLRFSTGLVLRIGGW